MAANIRLARKRAGHTQSELADILGLTDLMVVSKWERGVYRPSEQNLVLLSEKLGLPLAWFYTDHSNEKADR